MSYSSSPRGSSCDSFAVAELQSSSFESPLQSYPIWLGFNELPRSSLPSQAIHSHGQILCPLKTEMLPCISSSALHNLQSVRFYAVQNHLFWHVELTHNANPSFCFCNQFLPRAVFQLNSFCTTGCGMFFSCIFLQL